MEDIPFETAGLVADDVRALELTYNELKKKFNIGLPCNVHLPVKKFDLFSNNPDLVVDGVLPIPHPVNNCYLAFMRIHIYYNPVRGGGETVDYYRYQVWGFIQSKKNYGRALLRRETFADKLMGLIHPVELKFPDDQPFNHKFYVVSNDSEKTLLAMNYNFRNAVMDIASENIIIEITDDLLVMGDNCWLQPDEVITLAENVLKVASNC